MPRRPLSPRKMPQQERSQKTVDALLQAAAYILVRDGYTKLTTNRIADRAGVNIASLYQYFPSKEAIVAELRRRHMAETRAAAAQAMQEHPGQGLVAMTRALVAVGVAEHRVAPKLHHVLTEETPERRSRTGLEAETPLGLAARRQLARAGVADPELALWLVDVVIHTVLHRAGVERPAELESGQLTEELTTLLVRYLDRGRRRQPHASSAEES